jgi:hypothetical protein
MYLIQYADQFFFENKKQTQLFQMFKKNYPYLDPLSKHDEIMFTYELNVNECLSNATTYIQHDFKDEI